MFCSISGKVPVEAVYCISDGNIYEKELLLKYLEENDYCSPVNGNRIENLESDILQVKTKSSLVAPKVPSFTSIPSILVTLQNEWDALMLETFEIKKQLSATRMELSNSLYENDAAKRVIARLIKERDEARVQLSNFSASIPKEKAVEKESEMQVDGAEIANPLPAALLKAVESRSEEQVFKQFLIVCRLSMARKKRKAPETLVTPETLAKYTLKSDIKTLNTAKEPAVSSMSSILSTETENGTLVLTGGKDGTCSIILVVADEPMRLIGSTKAHKKPVVAVVFINSDSFLSASEDGTLKLWNIEAGGKMGWKIKGAGGGGFETAHHGGVSGLAVHPIGTFFASCGADNTLKLTSMESKETLSTTVLDGNPTVIQFHPDGLLMGVGFSDGNIAMYDMNTLQPVTTFKHGDSPISSISFNENGYYLASAAMTEQTAKVWDLRKYACVKEIDTGAEEGVLKVSFDHSGKYLFCTSDEKLQVYLSKKWDLVVEYKNHATQVTDFVVGGNCQFIVSGSAERLICHLSL